MRIFEIGTPYPVMKEIPETLPEGGLFVACNAEEAKELTAHFLWDEDTKKENISVGGNIQHINHDGYDYISIVHAEKKHNETIQCEIEMFISKQYLVLVLPEKHGEKIDELQASIYHYIEHSDESQNTIERIYHMVLNKIAADYSEVLERLEDELEALSEVVTMDPRKGQITEIVKLRKMAYSGKKNLRAISYISDEILEDENGLIHKQQLLHFRAVNARYRKLYEFAVSLYDLSGEILGIYDSNLTIKVNESIDKLTAIMMFLAAITVITGIFNIDLRFMPAIDSIIGYPLALALIAVLSIVLYRLIRKKNWL